jgi:Domain of unknown function (DUF1877)
MGMLGLHIALNDDELAELMAIPEGERADYVSETFEVAKFGTPECCETDRSWAYIHSALNNTDPDGPLEIGNEPKQGVFARLLGGKANPEDQSRYAIMGHDHILISEDYYIGLVQKERASGIADALESISVDILGDRVRKVHAKFNASGSADDAAEYAMGWYPGVVEFFRTASSYGKNIIFTVSY